MISATMSNLSSEFRSFRFSENAMLVITLRVVKDTVGFIARLLITISLVAGLRVRRNTGATR